MSGKINLKRWLAAFTFLLATWCTAASARTIYVDDDGPADFNTIQAAIDDSNDGDTIIVQPGLYQELVGFRGKNITLTSTNPGDFDVVAATIVDYSVGFRGTEDANCMLTGFKINHGISGVDYLIDPTGENHTHATISHCLLFGNRVSGGTVIKACDGTISNCEVADNLPISDVIDYAIRGCHGLIKNCTVAHNFLGIRVLQGGTTKIENCIIYGNGIRVEGGATVNILYSDVDWISGGGTVNWDPGNMDEDPCFVRVRDPFGAFNGEYHLNSQAGRWDPNSQSWVQDDVTSPCIDAGNPNSPIGLEPFPNGGLINMGAYGGTPEASKSYFGRPPCEIIIAGDVNGDCKVNWLDFQIIALHWLRDESQ
ncbi:MAG: hypothetical protein FVQ85_07235 [Planctomycetes bacterium]|nr:hypothetical protein [Planctomycetota bacterium]